MRPFSVADVNAPNRIERANAPSCAVAPHEPRITQIIEVNRNLLLQAFEEVNKLDEMLAPVLSLSAPKAECAGSGSHPSTGIRLFDSLDEQGTGLIALCERLRDINRRIAL